MTAPVEVCRVCGKSPGHDLACWAFGVQLSEARERRAKNEAYAEVDRLRAEVARLVRERDEAREAGDNARADIEHLAGEVERLRAREARTISDIIDAAYARAQDIVDGRRDPHDG